VAGQAYHWFDPSVALPEIARVLRPGGTLGLIWNVRDDTASWVARLSGVIGTEPLAAESPEATIDASGLFGPVETASFAFEQQLDRETLVALVASRSGIGALEPSERAETLALVERIYDEEAGSEGLVLPYVTLAYRAQRL
jgi:SAM-dependent methyltransferase